MSENTRDRIFNVINVLLMFIVAAVTLYPFWYCIVISFNEGVDAMKGGIYLWPRKWSVENYEFILTSSRTLRAILNSVLRTVIGTLLHIAFTGVAAYGLSKRWIWGRRVYMVIFVITMYFGGGLIPYYMLLRDLKLLDNFLVYVIPSMWSFYDAILFMSYYASIPESLEDAARIDGAGALRIFKDIILPGSVPIFATVALFQGVAQWGAWFDTAIYTKSDNLVTLQSIMTQMIRSAEAAQEMNKQLAEAGVTQNAFATIKPVTIRVATMVFTTFPIAVLYPFLQKYFIKGIMLGSVKG